MNTRLILNAKKEKIKTISGLDMFIEQARESFRIWFDIKPNIDKDLLLKIKKKINKK